jgi:hypothetical protein
MHISMAKTEPKARQLRVECLVEAGLPPRVRALRGGLEELGHRSHDAFRLLRGDFEVHRARIPAIYVFTRSSDSGLKTVIHPFG